MAQQATHSAMQQAQSQYARLPQTGGQTAQATYTAPSTIADPGMQVANPGTQYAQYAQHPQVAGILGQIGQFLSMIGHPLSGAYDQYHAQTYGTQPGLTAPGTGPEAQPLYNAGTQY